ncbi:hypothetical protein J1N35_001688, partial [Gossypium stocksii]
DYAQELRSKMLGSTIKVRFYMSFDALNRGWKVGCKPLIGLDGYFQKRLFKSEFLTTVKRDANSQMFPIVWVVVEMECTNLW